MGTMLCAMLPAANQGNDNGSNPTREPNRP
jgi:hypothetical protein